MPKVSIIVPSYNYARFLCQRLDSIERQSYKDFEVILLDDASTDESVQVLERFARPHRWQLICNECNSGNVFKQWNKGLRLATGQYVWIAEADDYADERFLETLVGRLEQHPQCGLAFCNSLRVDETGRVVDLVTPTVWDVDVSRWQQDFVANGHQECACFFIQENVIRNASAVVFKRELYDRIGPVDESLRLAADWKFWASILQLSDIAFVAEPLNYFRFHANTVRAKTRIWAEVTENLQVIKLILDAGDVPQEVLQDLHARVAVTLLYSWKTERPSATECRQARELIAGVQLRFSLRAARSFSRQVLQIMKSWLNEVPSNLNASERRTS